MCNNFPDFFTPPQHFCENVKTGLGLGQARIQNISTYNLFIVISIFHLTCYTPVKVTLRWVACLAILNSTVWMAEALPAIGLSSCAMSWFGLNMYTVLETLGIPEEHAPHPKNVIIVDIFQFRYCKVYNNNAINLIY